MARRHPGDALIVGLAALVSCGHAMWLAAHAVGVDSPDVARTYALALEAMRAFGAGDLRWLIENIGRAVPNPQLVPIWMGLWMVPFGAARLVAVGALLPFHVLAAAGLWRGGCAFGGRAGGSWALLAGLGAAGTLASGGEVLLDFPLLACVAYAAGEGAAGRWNRAAMGIAGAALVKLIALPLLAVMAVNVVWSGRARVRLGAVAIAALYLPNVDAIAAHLSDSIGSGAAATIGQRVAYLLQSTGTVAGPALLGGAVLVLLTRGDALTLRVLGWAAGALLGLLPLALYGEVRYLLPVVPLLAVASAGAATVRPGRWGLCGLGLLALLQVGGYHTDREGWPGRPVAFRGPVALPADATEPFDVDAVLDWLLAHAPPAEGGRTRVAFYLAGSDRLHVGLFGVRALERGLPIELVVVDDLRPLDQPTELGVVIAPKRVPTGRQGWRSGLPPATATLDWPQNYAVELWDRGLPPESLLASPQEAERRNHPSRQALWVYVDGEERGPLLEGASSAEVVRTDTGWEALFVREQALWRASSADGFVFGEARPLRDATPGQEAPIAAFDPAVVRLADGRLRLYAAELEGDARDVDPAAHSTRIVSWIGPTLDALVREPGVRIEGVGLVDPSVIEEAGGAWRMYLTEGRRRVVTATSVDGARFERDPKGTLEGYTVPGVAPAGTLFVQLQVMGWAVLARTGDLGTGAAPELLELCGTGPALVGDRLYYTRAADPCPAPVALPERRGSLDALLARNKTPETALGGVGGEAP
ncbi:MAG: hypothetical protein Q8P18_09325 [Pseudomonadota bacterium]|nr:hypothetical protein [Pseudomonadota bacterium]